MLSVIERGAEDSSALLDEVAKSPSAWDGKPRSKSDDPAAYAILFNQQPTRFVTYRSKPVTALVFEPPWYVWSYHVCSSSAPMWQRCERFFLSERAKTAGLYLRTPCQMSFSSDGMAANCAGSEIVP